MHLPAFQAYSIICSKLGYSYKTLVALRADVLAALAALA